MAFHSMVKVGDLVRVFDRYRFAIPLKGVVKELSPSNDGVKVTLKETNNYQYPIGRDVWIHEKQLEILKDV